MPFWSSGGGESTGKIEDINLNAQDTLGYTPIHILCLKEQLDMVRILSYERISLNAKINEEKPQFILPTLEGFRKW